MLQLKPYKGIGNLYTGMPYLLPKAVFVGFQCWKVFPTSIAGACPTLDRSRHEPKNTNGSWTWGSRTSCGIQVFSTPPPPSAALCVLSRPVGGVLEEHHHSSEALPQKCPKSSTALGCSPRFAGFGAFGVQASRRWDSTPWRFSAGSSKMRRCPGATFGGDVFGVPPL